MFFFVSFFHLATAALCLFWLTKPAVESVQLWSPEVVTAVYGGSVKVLCHYDPEFSKHTKYWCKGKIYDFCTIVVKTPRNRQSARNFITDDREKGFFTITMTYLDHSDEDMYWCVIAQTGRNIYTGVRLFISNAGNYSDPILFLFVLISRWPVLRWILFIVMFCGLVPTLMLARRIKTTGKIWLH
uniref:Ig-like domain-containing protein n=1 Tax=Mola mola TaxID=94237 RepID=A0A3Q4B9T1_MOLML